MNNHSNERNHIHPNDESDFNLIYIIRLVQQHFWYIAGVVLFSGILAIVFTTPYFYKPEYLSSTVVYPTNPERFDLANLFAEEPTVFLYGNSKQVEKLSNIANARSLKLAVIDSLNLWNAYGINKESDESPEHYALEMYNGYVNTIQIEGNGMKIEAYDVDPQRAADIVNLVVHLADERNKAMIIENKAKILSIYKKTEEELLVKVAKYRDSAQAIRKLYNIYNFERQTEALTKDILQTEAQLSQEKALLKSYQNYYRGKDSQLLQMEEIQRLEMAARIEGLTNHLSDLYENRRGSKINLEAFVLGIDQVRVLENLYLEYSDKLKEIQQKTEAIGVMDDAQFSTLLAVEPALPSDRKARPIRWLILFATLMITSIVSLISVVLIDRFVLINARSVHS